MAEEEARMVVGITETQCNITYRIVYMYKIKDVHKLYFSALTNATSVNAESAYGLQYCLGINKSCFTRGAICKSPIRYSNSSRMLQS